jgi:hypothetical protein
MGLDPALATERFGNDPDAKVRAAFGTGASVALVALGFVHHF